MNTVRRRVGALLAAAVLALMAVLTLADPASAHAVLQRTTPGVGQEVDTAPTDVLLHFGESVSLNERSLYVLDSAGKRVDEGSPKHPSGGSASDVTVALESNLPKGAYTVVWAVVSADSHPVRGSFSFGYGVDAGNPLAHASQEGAGVREVAATGRTLAFLGLALLLGGTVFFVVLYPEGLRQPKKQPGLTRGMKLLWAGWGLIGLGTVLVFLMQGVGASGLPFTKVTSVSLWGETLATPFGKYLVARAILLAVVVPLLLTLPRRPRGAVVDLVGVGLGLTVTWSLSGHASQGRLVPLTIVSDVVHLVSVSIWMGGLAVLSLVFLPRLSSASPGQVKALTALLPRWSKLAMGAVVVLVASGTYQSWRQVGTLRAYPDTEYGRVLLAKTIIVVLMLVLADVGRRWVRRSAARPRVLVHAVSSLATAQAPVATPAPLPEVRSLRRSVGLEAFLGIVVLSLAAVLVSSQPARDAYAPPFDATLTAGPLTVNVDVSTTKVGAEVIHLYAYDAQGNAMTVQDFTAQFTERDQGLGPIDVAFAQTAANHGTSTNAIVPLPGDWTLRISVDVDQFTRYVTTAEYTVRS